MSECPNLVLKTCWCRQLVEQDSGQGPRRGRGRHRPLMVRWYNKQGGTCRGGLDLHTNGSNKILFVQTPGVKLTRPFHRGRGWQLNSGHQEHTRRPGTLNADRRALLTARTARPICGTSLSFLWLCTARSGRVQKWQNNSKEQRAEKERKQETDSGFKRSVWLIAVKKKSVRRTPGLYATRTDVKHLCKIIILMSLNDFSFRDISSRTEGVKILHQY